MTTNPWMAPRCLSSEVKLLPNWKRYAPNIPDGHIPLYTALNVTTDCQRLLHGNLHSRRTHQHYQWQAVYFIHCIETQSDLARQLEWHREHSRDYWQTKFSLDRSMDNGRLDEYTVSGEWAYLRFRGAGPSWFSWCTVTSKDPLLATLSQPYFVEHIPPEPPEVPRNSPSIQCEGANLGDCSEGDVTANGYEGGLDDYEGDDSEYDGAVVDISEGDDGEDGWDCDARGGNVYGGAG